MPAEQKTVSSIQSFRNIIKEICFLSGQEFSENQVEKTAISLYDYWLNAQNDRMPNFKACEGAPRNLADADVDKTISYLMGALEILDPSKQLSPLLFEDTLDSDEEFDAKLSVLLPQSRLNGSKASIYRILILAVFVLGKTFSKAGNDKLALHMISLATMLQERINRTASRIESDDTIIKMMYGHLAKLALGLRHFEQAIEAGTKVIMRLDIKLAEVLGGEMDIESFDLDEYFTNLMVLAEAAESGEDYCSAVFAYRNAAELFKLEKRLLSGNQSLLDFITVPEQSSSKYQKEVCQLNLCLKLINAVELSDGDAMLSLINARSALEHFALIGDVGERGDIKESQLQFLLGRCIYKAVLALAGGMNLASSPPVAILNDGKAPTIKGLLEEAMEVLEDCEMPANCGDDSPDCQEGVLMQIAIVAIELRQDEKSRCILENLQMYEADLVKWDSHRKGKISKSTYSYLSSVVYSVEVFKRLLLVAPMTQLSKLASRLTLSSRKALNPDSPTMVQCSFCSMKCFNSDIKCEECAANTNFVWYCTVECKNDHLADHICSQGTASNLMKYFPTLS